MALLKTGLINAVLDNQSETHIQQRTALFVFLVLKMLLQLS